MHFSSPLTKVTLAIGFVILLAILIIPKLQFLQAQDEKSKEDTKKDKVHVYTQVLRPESVSKKLSVSGTVIPANEVRLTSETAGKITSLPLQEGEQVQKGELLVKINDSELQARLKKAQSQKKLLAQQVERKKKLLDKEGISQEAYDQKKTELESTKADIQHIKAQIDKTEIRAPFDGVVGLKHVSKGSYVSPDSKIATLRQLQPLKIDFSVPGKYAQSIVKGQSIEFTVNGIDSSMQARIYAIEPAIETSTRTLHIRALFDNENRQVLAGNYAEIDLTLASDDGVLMVPTEAVISELQGKKVFLYRNGKSVPQQIQTGQRQADRVEVTKGLNKGDTLITRGIQKVRPGSAVHIKGMQQPQTSKVAR